VELGLVWPSYIRLPHIRHHHEKLLQTFHGLLSFTVEDRYFFQCISIWISSNSIEMVLHVHEIPTNT
jgi:hypothetical protein